MDKLLILIGFFFVGTILAQDDQDFDDFDESFLFEELEAGYYDSWEEALEQPDSVYSLELNDRKLVELPSTIGQFKNLRKLTIRNTQLQSLPASVGNLEQLEELNLYKNKLTVLPNTLSNLVQLRVLDVSSNALKELPENIGQLTKLEELYAHKNELTQIPLSIKKITGLRGITVGKNTDLRQLPLELGKLKQLLVIDAKASPIDSQNVAELKKMLPNCKIRL
ncbi:MAG: leucine-rich repeat domain-containing protein [Aureispira sp.]